MSESHIVEVDANEHAVTSVTVYQHRAEITRRFKLQLEVGQSNVEISRLPTCMDESSLRVDGLGNAIIFDVIISQLRPTLPPLPEGNERLASLEADQAKTLRELTALGSQSRVLEDFSHSVTAKNVDPKGLVAFLDVLADRGLSLAEEMEVLNAQVDKLRREIEQERAKMRPQPEAAKLSTKVTVIVLAEDAGPAELQLVYVVALANWTPLYDFRATVEPSGKDTTYISLSYRASITQTTGEDWSNVHLSLSTSAPLAGSEIPKLSEQHIGALMTRSRRPHMRMASISPPAYMAKASRMLMSVSGDSDAARIIRESAPPTPPPMVMPTATATEGALSTSFDIDGLSTIPSDGTTHKVAIGVLNLTANLEWVAVPKLNTNAFLQCTITNSSPYVLLEGPSNVFLDGSFVAKSTIPYVTPQDTFACSVGVDPSIRIEYHPQNKKARVSGSLFSSKIDTTIYTQRIKVSNKRQTSINITVRDQVPVSDDAKFKVIVLEPKDLAAAPAGRALAISPGVVCFWARKEWDKSTVDTDVKKSSQASNISDGQVEWECRIGAGKSYELVLSWEIAGPVGETWITY